MVGDLEPRPRGTASDNTLNGVSCTRTGPAFCVTVGGDDASGDQTLVESWSGTTWSIVPSPNEGTGSWLGSGLQTGFNGGDAVSCTSLVHHAQSQPG